MDQSSCIEVEERFVEVKFWGEGENPVHRDIILYGYIRRLNWTIVHLCSVDPWKLYGVCACP